MLPSNRFRKEPRVQTNRTRKQIQYRTERIVEDYPKTFRHSMLLSLSRAVEVRMYIRTGVDTEYMIDSLYNQ